MFSPSKYFQYRIHIHIQYRHILDIHVYSYFEFLLYFLPHSHLSVFNLCYTNLNSTFFYCSACGIIDPTYVSKITQIHRCALFLYTALVDPSLHFHTSCKSYNTAKSLWTPHQRILIWLFFKMLGDIWKHSVV